MLATLLPSVKHLYKMHCSCRTSVEVDVNKRIHIPKWTLGRLCVNSGRIHRAPISHRIWGIILQQSFDQPKVKAPQCLI